LWNPGSPPLIAAGGAGQKETNGSVQGLVLSSVDAAVGQAAPTEQLQDPASLT